MKINKAKLDKTQLEYLAQAEKLQSELIAQGFMASRVEPGENRCDFIVLFFDGVRSYEIRRIYDGSITVMRQQYGSYNHVSSSTRSEIYAKYKDNKMNVITAKRLQNKIDLDNAYHAEMEKLEAEATNKVTLFLESIKGLPFVYSRRDYNDEKSEITAGYVVNNGIEFSFEISQDGYISKKLRVNYSVDSTLENYLKLSDNKY